MILLELGRSNEIPDTVVLLLVLINKRFQWIELVAIAIAAASVIEFLRYHEQVAELPDEIEATITIIVGT